VVIHIGGRLARRKLPVSAQAREFTEPELSEGGHHHQGAVPGGKFPHDVKDEGKRDDLTFA
jgi:hypothetical protein